MCITSCTWQGGVCQREGVCQRGLSAKGGGGVCSGGCLPMGVSVRGCLPKGDVSAWMGVYPSKHWGRHPSPWTEWQTGVETLPCLNYVVDGKRSHFFRRRQTDLALDSPQRAQAAVPLFSVVFPPVQLLQAASSIWFILWFHVPTRQGWHSATEPSLCIPKYPAAHTENIQIHLILLPL